MKVRARVEKAGCCCDDTGIDDDDDDEEVGQITNRMGKSLPQLEINRAVVMDDPLGGGFRSGWGELGSCRGLKKEKNRTNARMVACWATVAITFMVRKNRYWARIGVSASARVATPEAEEEGEEDGLGLDDEWLVRSIRAHVR